jgi:hypothetical protein
LTLNGDRVRYDVPKDARALVDALREHRDEVLRVLRDREPEKRSFYQLHPQPMPAGVKLLEWAPKQPPVAIATWAIVNDVSLFIHVTLGQLRAALSGRSWLAGNRSVRELVERLEQVGVKVSIEATR